MPNTKGSLKGKRGKARPGEPNAGDCMRDELVAAVRAAGGTESVDLAAEERKAAARAARAERAGCCTEHAPVRPYRDMARDPDADWLRDERALLQFDPVAFRDRLHAWLERNGYADRDEEGRVTLRAIDDFEQSAGATKARAVAAVLTDLVKLRGIWAAERLADRRWADTLSKLHDALDGALPRAVVRTQEESYLNPATAERAVRVRRLADALEAAHAEVVALQRMHTRYVNDPLPAVEPKGRPPKGALGALESVLHEGGFTHREVGEFTGDAESVVRQRVNARRSGV